MTREIREELEAVRRRFLKLLTPLQTPEGASRDASSDQERLRRALWAAVKGLDPLLTEAQVPPDLDLTKDDPATQTILYDFVVREYFSPHLLDDPGDIHVPGHTPEECELRVFFQLGRWFVSWMKLEEDMNRPEGLTRELLVFERGKDNRFVFTEV
ncbi:MAG: hypothetical protein ACJ759_19160 [Thermoanaerobaculia bacterium]